MAHRHHAIDYVELAVTDMEAAKRFYAAAFGWTFTDYAPGAYVGFAAGEGEGEMGGFRHEETVAPDAGPLVILFSTDLDASLDAVRSAPGGEIVTEPFEFPGGRRFHFRDPSGNVLAVWAER